MIDNDINDLLNKIVLFDSKRKALKEYQVLNFNKKPLVYKNEYYKMYCEIQKLQDSIVEMGLDIFNKLSLSKENSDDRR